jgi:hypothetical protein
MALSAFEIEITRQGWIDPDESDMPIDLCSHGDIRLEIGGQVIVSGEEEQWYTISTSRSLCCGRLKRSTRRSDR